MHFWSIAFRVAGCIFGVSHISQSCAGAGVSNGSLSTICQPEIFSILPSLGEIEFSLSIFDSLVIVLWPCVVCLRFSIRSNEAMRQPWMVCLIGILPVLTIINNESDILDFSTTYRLWMGTRHCTLKMTRNSNVTTKPESIRDDARAGNSIVILLLLLPGLEMGKKSDFLSKVF